MRRIVDRLTYANVMATIGVFIALGGGAYAMSLKKNSVKSKHIKDGQVMSADVKDDGLAGTDIDIDEASLDSAILQRRVSAGCSAGEAIRAVATDGTVSCEADDAGGLPSGPAGGDLDGTYPDPVIANGAVGAAEVLDGSLGTAELSSSTPGRACHPLRTSDR